MNRSLKNFLLLVILLPTLGALAGRLAGPSLARFNYTVQLAERVWLENSQGLTEPTLQSTAFRATGQPVEQLYAQARQIRDKFRMAGLWFGLWCGLVVALRINAIVGERTRKEYEADPADCVACGRCYDACPVQREQARGKLV